jgi:hypothetical protein
MIIFGQHGCKPEAISQKRRLIAAKKSATNWKYLGSLIGFGNKSFLQFTFLHCAGLIMYVAAKRAHPRWNSFVKWFVKISG